MKTKLATLSIFFATLPLLTALSQAFRPIPSLPKGMADTLVVVVLGSSTAAGSGATPIDSAWAYRYAEYLRTRHAPARLVNLARGGYTSYHLQPDWFTPPADRFAPDSARNISRALRLNPDAIILNLPSNDAARNYTLTEQMENFERIARVCDSASIPIWFSTTQPRNFGVSQQENLMDMREWLLMRFAGRVIDFWDGIATPNGGILPLYDYGDGVHLNNAGHALLFERVVRMDIPGAVGATSAAGIATLPAALSSVVYPNPFISNTTVSVDLAYGGHTIVYISGVLGKIHRTVFSGYLCRGRHTIRTGMADLPAGVYLYSVHSGKEVRHGKILKIPG